MYGYIQKRIKTQNISGVEILNCAAWYREKELFFMDMVDGSRVARNGLQGQSV